MTVKAEYKDIPIATAVTESPLTTGETPGYNTMAANKDEGDWVKGEVQPAAFRDVGFGIAFWMQFVAICVLGGFFVTGKIPGEPFWLDDRAEQEDYFEGTIRRFLYQSSGDEEGWEDFDSGPFMWSTLFSFVAAPTVTIFMFSLLYSKAELLITASISISIGFNVALAVLSMIAGVLLGTIMFLFFAAITACYARAIWNRIPYAGKLFSIAPYYFTHTQQSFWYSFAFTLFFCLRHSGQFENSHCFHSIAIGGGLLGVGRCSSVYDVVGLVDFCLCYDSPH